MRWKLPRVYGLFVLLVLCSIAPTPIVAAQLEKSQDTSSIDQSLRAISATLDKIQKSEYYNPSCDPEEEDRRSDLCAQWKAADAAQESSIWTGRGFWLDLGATMVGFLTLVAASLAAKYARDAATHTKDGVEVAKGGLAHSEDVARRQLRAYVMIESVTVTSLAENQFIIVQIEARNTGQTPAKRLRHEVNFAVHPAGSTEPLVSGNLETPGSEGVGGANLLYRFGVGSGRGITREELYQIRNGGHLIFIWGSIYYEDIWGSTFATDFKFKSKPDRRGYVGMTATHDGNGAT